jgi:hypothetical protein
MTNALTILPPLKKSFERRVAKLADEGAEIVTAYSALTSRMLDFAARFKEVSDEAVALDQGGEGIHSQYLKDQLALAISTADKSIFSRWNTIGTYAGALGKFSDKLPPQRDSLYQLALALKEKRPVEKWVTAQKVTVDSSFRDILALRKVKRRTASSKVSSEAQVTLCFSSYGDAADVLAELVNKNPEVRVRSRKAFAEALKAKLGVNAFKKLEDRIRQD